MLNAIRSLWTSVSGLELVFALIGALMGGVLVLSSWKGSVKGTELKNDPRIKSLGWAILGFFATLLGRWEKLLEVDNLNRTRLLVSYALPLLIVAMLGVVVIAGMIYVRAVPLMRRLSKPRSEALAFVLEYLHHGYQQYQQDWAKAEHEYAKAEEQRRHDELRQSRELNAMAATLLAADILLVHQYRVNPAEELRASICRQILQHICLIVQTYTGGQALNANVMVAIPTAKATPADWEKTRFVYQERERYGHLLMLRDYAYPQGQEHFAVPVENPDRVPDWHEWVLLGAPLAFLRKQPLVVQTSDLDFARHVPPKIKQESKAYFKDKGFKSFACLVIPGDGGPRGILNVESHQEHIFEESEEVQNEIAMVLHPLCALLGLTVE